MHHREFRATRYLLPGALTAGAILLVVLAGCSTDKQPLAPRQTLVPLTLATQASGAASFRAAGTAGTFSTTATESDSVNVTLTKAYLVVRDVRFILSDMETGGGGDTTGTGDSTNMSATWDVGDDSIPGMGDDDSIPDMGDEGEGVVFHGPFAIDLLDHTAMALDTLMVPPGDYHRVQGHLQALHAGDAPAADLPFLVGSTVYLEGTVDGSNGGPFTFEARIDDEFQIRGNFTVQSDTPATAFITFNPDQWLIGRDGRFLDPRNPDNLFAIKSTIRHAIKACMDDNHDGRMDDHMHDAD